MSSNTSNTSNTSNRVSASIAAPLDNKNIFLENLDLHIPRISPKTTPEHIARTLYEMSVAEVDYVDIVATKDPETKAVMYYSAFVRLIKWGPERFPAGEFYEKKMFKIFLGRYSSDSAERYWVLYPNKNPLPRTRVNIHQLAFSTEKLFENAEQHAERSAWHHLEIENLKTANNECNAKLAAAEAQIALLSENVAYLMRQFESRDDKKQKENDAKLKDAQSQTNTMVDIIKGLMQADKQDCDDLKAAYNEYLREDVNTGVQSDSKQVKKVDDDDCMFSKPVRQYTYDYSYVAATTVVDKMESEFLLQLDDLPVQCYTISTATEAKMQCSRDYCGNQ
jgi:hypothetical protein